VVLKQKTQGTINFGEIRGLGDNAALDTSVYTFDLTKNGNHQKVQARYTFVYKRTGERWKILNHHSSAMQSEEASVLRRTCRFRRSAAQAT